MRTRYVILSIVALWVAANGGLYVYSVRTGNLLTSSVTSQTTVVTQSCSNFAVVAGSGGLTDLISLYDCRPDLQSTFPEVKQGNYRNLVNWAWRVVNRQVNDSAYDRLAPYGYWYALMMVYDSRPDLQTAFPNAYTSPVSYQNLLCWAKGVAEQKTQDAAFDILAPYANNYATSCVGGVTS